MNLGEARDALAERGFDYLSGLSVDLMLNRARNDFEDFWPWPWLRTEAGGPTPLDVADLKYVLRVTDSNGDGLWGIDYDDVGKVSATVGAAGGPRYWYLVDGVAEHVNVLTLPAGGYVDLLYIRATPELVDPGDEPEIPPRYQALWIDWAVLRGYQDSDNMVAQQALQADVNARMTALVERYEVRNRMHAPFMASYGFSEDE
jgi:hypothetical protein